MELSTSSSDHDPREALPLRQQEDLEPSTTEHGGEEAGSVHVSVWLGVLSYTGRRPRLLGLGLEQRLASHHLSFTLQSQCMLCWVLFVILWEAFCPHIHTSKCW